MSGSRITIVLCGGILVLSMPFYFTQLSLVNTAWLSAESPSEPFVDWSSFRNGLTAMALIASSLMAPIGLAAVASRQITKLERTAKILFSLSMFLLLLVVVALMILYNTYGGTERHLGQTSLAIHSGTTYCFVSMFVVYRLIEAWRKGMASAALFERQLAVLCVAPFLSTSAYGLWFLALGHDRDGDWAQQVSLTFGSFLVPMLVIYVGSYVYRDKDVPVGLAIVCLAIALIALAVGYAGYTMSSVQPALI